MSAGDWCSIDGAKRLALKIQAYWQDRGYDVDIKLVEAGFLPAMRSARTDVRSDMVNGMPRRIAPDAEPRNVVRRSASVHQQG